jgi:3-dehydroquinate synthase
MTHEVGGWSGTDEGPAARAQLRCVDAGRDRSYVVWTTRGLVTEGRSPDALHALVDDRQVLVVATPTVAALVGDCVVGTVNESAASVDLLVIAVDETTKTMRAVEHVCERACTLRLEREAIIVALGGGICTDIVTVAASMIRRGVRNIRLPTTLVGQVDASIGIKGAVNFRGKKSALGVFHPPTAVFVDSSALATLPRTSVSDGIAEVLKVALLGNRPLFDLLEEDPTEILDTRCTSGRGDEIVALALEAMLTELGPNLYEDRSYARRVDFGHTFSPVLEAGLGFRISHGAAVAIDLALSFAISLERGAIDHDAFDRVVRVLKAYELPVYTPHLTVDLCRSALAEAIRHRGGSLNLVAPDGLASVTFCQDQTSIERSLSGAIGHLASMHARDVVHAT